MRKIISKNRGFNLNFSISILLFIALFINITTNVLIFAKIDNVIEEKIENQKELERPADLEILSVIDSTCADCFDIVPFIENIKKLNVNIINESEFQRDTEQAKELIEKYKIEKIPTFIIKGELEKDASLAELWTKIGEIKNGNFVFNKVMPPYVSAETGEIRGKVNLTVISDKGCKDCFSASFYENLPKQLGLSITETNRVEYRTPEGRALVRNNNIKSIPTIIIQGDLGAYSLETLDKFGDIDEDKFILTEVNPPYISTISGLLKGGLNLTVLTDNSCDKCYDVNVYDNIIKQFRLYIKNDKQVDMSSYNGKYLIDKYKIEAVPTIIITGDMNLYNKPNSVWSNIGTTEKDGAYVLRKDGIKQLGAYKNLITEEIIGTENSK